MDWKSKLKKFEVIDSTNDQLKRYLEEDAPYRIVLAKRQTRGRGQLDKVFESPAGGLYFSIALKANYDLSKLKYLTIRVALAIKDVLDYLYGIDLQLKWINDLILENKKLGGILVESKFNKQNKLDYIVVGIGINLLEQEFSDLNLINKAISLAIENYDEAIKDILDMLIPSLYELEHDFDIKNLIEDYNKCLFLKNETISIKYLDNTIEAKLISVNKDLSITVLENKRYLYFDYGNYKIQYPHL